MYVTDVLYSVVFIESDVFTEDVLALLDDDEYAAFQQFLADHPDIGDVIQGTGGLRKIRWAARGRGKRAGIRVIYFYRAGMEEIRLLLIYRKGLKDDLTPREKTVLRSINEGW
jgi:mRNA-degrading endonuclease RelE of RelBE toxin-antitoxin system